MQANEVTQFKLLLKARRAELIELSERAAASRKPVALDQQSVGRLSRQDALQQQAMANAQEARRRGELQRIEKALARIDDESYGWCDECGDSIPKKRLEIDPTAQACATCAGRA